MITLAHLNPWLAAASFLTDFDLGLTSERFVQFARAADAEPPGLADGT
jgi:hypothetical protein